MPDLNFTIEDARPVRHAAAPTLAFMLRVVNAAAEPIHTAILRCQIHLETARRRYSAAEQRRLADLFGEPERWGETLKSMLWTNTNVILQPFERETAAEVPVPCTFDFNVAATKYFAGIESGEIPLTFYFSGTVFYAAENGLQAEQISWDREAAYRLPIETWRRMMDIYYPNTAWLCLRRDAFDRLYDYKVHHGLPTFEEALERMIR